MFAQKPMAHQLIIKAPKSRVTEMPCSNSCLGELLNDMIPNHNCKSLSIGMYTKFKSYCNLINAKKVAIYPDPSKNVGIFSLIARSKMVRWVFTDLLKGVENTCPTPLQVPLAIAIFYESSQTIFGNRITIHRVCRLISFNLPTGVHIRSMCQQQQDAGVVFPKVFNQIKTSR